MSFFSANHRPVTVFRGPVITSHGIVMAHCHGTGSLLFFALRPSVGDDLRSDNHEVMTFFAVQRCSEYVENGEANPSPIDSAFKK